MNLQSPSSETIDPRTTKEAFSAATENATLGQSALIHLWETNLSVPVNPFADHSELQFAEEIGAKVYSIESKIASSDSRKSSTRNLLAGATFARDETLAFYVNGSAMTTVLGKLGILDDFYAAPPRRNKGDGWELEVPRRDSRGLFVVTHTITTSGMPARLFFYKARR